MSEKDRPDPDGTEMIDLGDTDVSAVDIPPSSRAGHERSFPPPLPPEVRASTPLMTELSGPPSNAPAPPAAYVSVAPPPPRSNRFYAMLIVGFVAAGVVVGLGVALSTRGEKKAVVVTSPSASHSAAAAVGPTGTVMTLPTIDMNDDEADGGGK